MFYLICKIIKMNITKLPKPCQFPAWKIISSTATQKKFEMPTKYLPNYCKCNMCCKCGKYFRNNYSQNMYEDYNSKKLIQKTS